MLSTLLSSNVGDMQVRYACHAETGTAGRPLDIDTHCDCSCCTDADISPLILSEQIFL